LFCAALIAETWAYFHGVDPAPQNQDAAAAAHILIRRRVPALQEAAMGGSSDSHFESEKGFKKRSANGGKAPPPQGQLTFLATTDLNPDPRNPRKHDWAQIQAIARSIEAFGFNAPILINKNKQIIAGHGRFEAAKLNACTQVPVICLEHLTRIKLELTCWPITSSRTGPRGMTACWPCT
jgi:hypothetical protein